MFVGNDYRHMFNNMIYHRYSMAQTTTSQQERTPRTKEQLVSGIQDCINVFREQKATMKPATQEALIKRVNFLMSILIEAKGRVN